MHVVYFVIAVTLAAVSDVAALPGQGELSAPSDTVEQPRMWSKQTIQCLLVNVKQQLLANKMSTNKPIWREVAVAMNDVVPGITADQCNWKWKHLKSRFRKYVDNLKGEDPIKMTKPEFYNEIAEIFGRSRTSTAAAAFSPGKRIGRRRTANLRYTLDTTAENSEMASNAGDIGDQPWSPPAEPVRKKLRRDYSIERLEEQIERLIEYQAAATENMQRQFGDMIATFDRQHRERMTVMNKLIQAVSATQRNCYRHDGEDEELNMTAD